MEISAIIAIVFSLLLIAFLSGLEIAFISANKFSLELGKKHKTYSGRVWAEFAQHPSKFIGTILLAVNTILVVYALLVSSLLKKAAVWFSTDLLHLSDDTQAYVRLIFEIIVATAIMLFVEFAGKAVFKAKSTSVLSNGFIAYLAKFFYAAFSAVTNLLIRMAEWILKIIFDIKPRPQNEAFSKIDLEQFLQQSKPVDAKDEKVDINKTLFENALTLGDTKVRECLVPRKEIIAMPATASIEELRQKFIETRLSKLIIYDKDIDNIIGYVHQLDLFRNPQAITEILLPIPMIPESMAATALMDKFSKDRKTIAWVIDEFGGTAGIVTMEDLLEELFGEIKDEYDDDEEYVDKQLAQNEYIFSGRMELDSITEKYGLQFFGDEGTETLSGYIIAHNNSIPKQKQRVIIDNYEFDILSVGSTRIETVKLKVLK